MRQQPSIRSSIASRRPLSSQDVTSEIDRDASPRSAIPDTWIRWADVRLRPDHAPLPRAAHQRRDKAGAATSPRTGLSPSTRAMRVAHTGTPRTKLFVPSIGSITHRRGPCPESNSSPWTASRGRVRASGADQFLGLAVSVADPSGRPWCRRAVRRPKRHRHPFHRVGEDVGEAKVVVIHRHVGNRSPRGIAAGWPVGALFVAN